MDSVAPLAAVPQSVTELPEPACGTGRLMFRMAQAGYDVAGLDLNEKAVDFSNARLEKHGRLEVEQAPAARIR